jgi:hypothetical protein
MKPPESSPRSFGSFLDAVQGPPEQASATGQVSVKLLRQLSGGPLPVQDLMQRSGIPLIDFAEVLKQMRQADLVCVKSSSLGDQVGLTDIGVKVMSLGEL